MQPILTAAEMRRVDRVTIEERGIPGLILMENAGARVYELLAHGFGPLGEQRIVILCGKGNNGGDGLVVARHLITRGHAGHLRVVLCSAPEELSGDAAANYRMLEAVDGEVLVIRNAADWQKHRPALQAATLLVDALLGTGLRGPAAGLYLEIIRDVNANFSQAQVVAIDMPSGLPSDSGAPIGESIRADYTVTFTAPKVSQIFPPNSERVGKLRVAPIGTAPAVLAADPKPKLLLVEACDIAGLFGPRRPTAHKGDFGHVLVVGGSRAKPGAALMAATAALRAGAGLVTVATAAGAAGLMVSHTPELMTQPVEELADGSIGESSYQPEWLDRKSVVAVGPGLGVGLANQELARRIVGEAAVPLVVDADGLTALAASQQPPWTTSSPLPVLTPHPGEMARLTGLDTKQIEQRRVEVARQFAEQRSVYLVLKGHRTLLATPDGRVLVNPTGTPAMASGGSGDILTGLIAGFLGQFPAAAPEIVIAAAIYLHGLAAELAAQQHGELSMIATDILAALPRAIASLQSG